METGNRSSAHLKVSPFLFPPPFRHSLDAPLAWSETLQLAVSPQTHAVLDMEIRGCGVDISV